MSATLNSELFSEYFGKLQKVFIFYSESSKAWFSLDLLQVYSEIYQH